MHYLLEEAHELLQAIDEQDDEAIAEELGDVGLVERLSGMLEPRYEIASVIPFEFSMGPNGGLGVKES